MALNRGVAYMGPGKVEIQSIDFPKLALGSRKCDHGVILKVVTTNICGSDQRMVRGRTTAPNGLILGHEITGEVIEKGHDVEFVKEGDLCSVPISLAAVAAIARKARRASASASTPRDQEQLRATSTWAAGSAAKPNM
jgi:glutathione-independent formaldehyde dehydrogenase